MPEKKGLKSFRWLDGDQASEEGILRRILQQASQEIEGLSPDPQLADPVVLLLLKAFAREYAELYRQMEQTTDRAFRALVRRLLTFPRAPHPAHTVLQFQVTDRGVRVDESLMAVGRRAVAKAGQEELPLYFTPLGSFRLGEAVPTAAILVGPGGDAAPLQSSGEWKPGPPPMLPGWNAPEGDERARLYIAFDGAAPVADDLAAGFFLEGEDRSCRSCLWGTWERVGVRGEVEARIEPGRLIRYHPREMEPDLFSFRSDAFQEVSLFENRFVKLPLGGGEGLAGVPEAAGGAAAAAVARPAEGSRREWWRVTLPPETDLETLRAMRFRGNCVPAINRQISRVSFNVAAVPEQSVVLPVRLDDLLRIEEILDLGSGQTYRDRLGIEGFREPRTYFMREDSESRVVLVLKDEIFSRRLTKIEVAYATTMGQKANGLDRGAIKALYENHPGLKGVTNVTPTLGGEPPRPLPEREDELRSALRTHGRCVVAQDYREMARQFDPRKVDAVEVGSGVTLTPRGLRRCVEVLVRIRPQEFVSEGEREHFTEQLQSHLESRSPVTEAVRVRLVSPE